MKTRFYLLIGLVLVLSQHFAKADTQPLKVAVLPSTDSTTYNLGTPLQKALERLYQETGSYLPSLSEEPLQGFTPIEVSRAMRNQNVGALSFVLLEPERISVFLFDYDHPLQFIVSSKTLDDVPASALDSAHIETKFRAAFKEVLRFHKEERFQELPGARSERVATYMKHSRQDKKIADETRVLFRELASQTDSPLYLGAQIGMSRFRSQNTSSSTVTFGVNAGYQIKPRISAELGVAASTYLIGSLGARYALPFKEEIVKLSIGLDVASVVASITQNSGYGSPNLTYNSPPLKNGSFFVGPGIFFDIPLLGAVLRGDLRFYTGNGTIIVGTYGFVYYL
ncbi:hypothetical protein EBT16_01805 [bacterium]|nr:hypothetical protein [bacterium]